MTSIVFDTKTGKVHYQFTADASNEDFDAACEKVKNPLVEGVENLTTTELTKIYNALSGEKIAKFATVNLGIERVEKALKANDVPVWENANPIVKPTAAKAVVEENEMTASKKTGSKKVASKKTAPKAAKVEKGERKKWGAAEFIREELKGGATDVDKIIDKAKAKFPEVKATRGYVRWLARGIGLEGQVPSTRGRPAAEKAPAKKVAAKKAAAAPKKAAKKASAKK